MENNLLEGLTAGVSDLEETNGLLHSTEMFSIAWIRVTMNWLDE
jgi:hypothetical protein